MAAAEKLFQVHARCQLASRPGELHQISKPMPWGTANGTLLEWSMEVKQPDWEFTIEEAESV